MLQFALCYHLGVLGKGTNHMILNLGSMEDAEQQSFYFFVRNSRTDSTGWADDCHTGQTNTPSPAPRNVTHVLIPFVNALT